MNLNINFFYIGKKFEYKGVSIVSSKINLKFIDLFCGAGGSALGFIQEKFELINSIDIDEDSCNTFFKNLSYKPMNLDIRKVLGEDLCLGFSSDEIDLLVACPPCQGFTTIGKKLDIQDPRNQLINEFLRIITEISPKIIVFENILGLMRAEMHFKNLITSLNKRHYFCKFKILNFADYGVSQKRKRIIILGTRLKTLKNILKMPEPTYVNPKNVEMRNLKPWLTARDAIGDLPALKNGEQNTSINNHAAPNHTKKTLDYIKKVPKNGGSKSSVSRQYWHECHRERKSGFENMMGRISWDSPGPTITSGCINVQSGRFIHPDQDRGITIREAARFQGFPDDFVFFGSKRSQAYQVGNALPPPFARAIARQIKEIMANK